MGSKVLAFFRLLGRSLLLPVLTISMAGRPLVSLANTHYVSNTGTSIPPYTSWATATDSLRAAIEASAPYDTVLVAAGSYTCDSLILKRGMLFQGAGMDSTYVKHNGVTGGLLVISDSSVTRGFHFDGIVDTLSGSVVNYRLYSAVSAYANVNALVAHNRVTNAEYAFTLVDNSLNNAAYRVQVDSNDMRSFLQAIFAFGTSTRVTNNQFFIQDDDIYPTIDQTYGNAEIVGNRFYKEVVNAGGAVIDLGPIDTVDVRNNLIVCSSGSTGALVWLNRTLSGPITYGQVVNNTFVGSQYGVFADHADVTIANNLFAFTRLRAVRPWDSFVQYNLFWRTQEQGIPFDTAALASLNNLFVDPMFLDTAAYLLQFQSPAINSGEPSILDIDGTRSDIGYAGGPSGFAYSYEDLPPRTPAVLDGAGAPGLVNLFWRPNTESDLLQYYLYRSTTTIAFASQGLLLDSIVGDTTFVDTTVEPDQGYFYRIAAVDQQFLESPLSPELNAAASGVSDPPLIQPVAIALGFGYPNPFNASISIPLLVQSAGPVVAIPVHVDVYSTTGSHVATLLDGRIVSGGSPLVQWDGTSSSGQPCGSGTYFVRLTAPGVTETQKIVLLK